VDDSNGLREGMRVEANYRGHGNWYSGQIRRKRDGDTFDIDYDDGTTETHVDALFIRLVDDGGSNSNSSSSSSSSNRIPSTAGFFSVGEEVECRWQGRRWWFRGQIRAVHAPDSLANSTASTIAANTRYDIRYRDGDQENLVPVHFIRLYNSNNGNARQSSRSTTHSNTNTNSVSESSSTYQQSQPQPQPMLLEVGSRVEANWRNGGVWYRGVVHAVRHDPTVDGRELVEYDIDYDDGDTETAVPDGRVRLRGEHQELPSVAPAADAFVLPSAGTGTSTAAFPAAAACCIAIPVAEAVLLEDDARGVPEGEILIVTPPAPPPPET